jgi:hypothetical protein
MTNMLAGYLQSLGDMYQTTIQTVSHSLIPVLQSIVLVGLIAGIGLIGYDSFLNRPNVKELAKVVRRDRDELKQLDGQNSEPNEVDDRYTPTNSK